MIKIVIFGLVGLGDMIHFSPCMRALKEYYPDSEITLVTTWPVVEELFNKSPYIDEIISFDFLKSSFIEKLRKILALRERKFDISILPFPSFRREFNIFSWLVNARKRYAFSFDKGRFMELTFLNNFQIRANRTIHNVENNINMIKAMGLTVKNTHYDIPFTFSESFMQHFLIDNDLHLTDLKIGIHPGSDKRGKERRLEIEKFAKICDLLAVEYNARAIVFFGPHEVDLKSSFLQHAEKKHVIVENLKLNEVAQVISICQVFVSNDSGLMHMASAIRVPTVAIFGPTNPLLVGPWGVRNEIVHLGLECSPCFYFTEKHSVDKPLIECKIDDKFACIKMLQVNQVLEKIGLILKEKNRIR